MQNVRLTVMARSDVGRVRTHNEDTYLVSDLATGATLDTPAVGVDVRDRGVLMVVSDGMGGHAAGDVASALVVESLRKSLSDPEADASSLQRLIDSAVQRANQDVQEAAQAADRQGMGATLAAVLVHDQEAYVAAVGDSRSYLLRAGRLRQITKDQSFVQMLVDAGVLTPEQAKDSPQKNMILQAVGREQTLRVAIGRLSLRHGDRLLLCSDGLTNYLDDGELGELLDDAELATICERMIALANERGGDDNVTALVAHVEGEALPQASREERATQTIEVLQEYTAAAAEPPAPPPAPADPPAPAADLPAPARPASRPWLVPALLVGIGVAALLAWRLLS